MWQNYKEGKGLLNTKLRKLRKCQWVHGGCFIVIIVIMINVIMTNYTQHYIYSTAHNPTISYNVETSNISRIGLLHCHLKRKSIYVA